MERINFRVLNNRNNILTAKANGIYPKINGRYLIIEISNLEFPYLQGDIKKIKKAMGFIK